MEIPFDTNLFFLDEGINDSIVRASARRESGGCFLCDRRCGSNLYSACPRAAAPSRVHFREIAGPGSHGQPDN